ncbi:hypothetical protein KXQ82_06245 [Mucilaginibacter sp. HMF5004]|uniref:hypothetical protein n=1 Tax=Mucilaginibacter rivuli TaxID=2857527 RepID=UPI001C5E625E|nr:hypothetical protein [Mucilaginibacter rivuli]MBW4889306.1 hypothetical protein [Mucilaginibacter rivuli]
MKFLFLSAFILFFACSSNAQGLTSKFQQGYYYDINGQKVEGLIRTGTGKKLVENEGYITFKEDDKANKQNLSASMIHGFVIGRDSFIVARAPRVGTWSKNELDFMQVMVNSPLKLYAINASGGGGGGGGIQPSFGLGMGGGSVGGIGTGIGLSLGSGMFGGGNRAVYYFGSDTGSMTEMKKQNFVDVISEVMADEPEIVEKVKAKKYSFGDMEKLIKAYNEKHETKN